MKIRTHYARIERVVYEFSESDIKSALEQHAKIKYKPGVSIAFEIDIGNEDNGYKITAIITEIFETPELEASDGE